VDNGKQALRDEHIASEHEIFQPRGLPEVLELKEKFGGEAIFIAGGTLIQLQREQGIELPRYLISLEKATELKGGVADEAGGVVIGALTPLADLRLHSAIVKGCGLLIVAAKGVGSPAIRNRATIGGNIIYGVGDLIPALLSLDAELTVYEQGGFREIILWEFIKNREEMKNFILVSIKIPVRTLLDTERTFYRKIGRREAFIPSVVTVSGRCSIREDGRIADIRIAAGGGASAPQRLVRCEDKLLGVHLNSVTLKEIYSDICKEYTPTPDAFLGTRYRKLAAANVIVSELEQHIADREGK
jgi:carbon-monoxide dehydrogenase medium subunit